MSATDATEDGMVTIGQLRDGLLQDWLRARDGVITQVELLSEDQLCWLPGPGARTGMQIARHIADSSAGLTEYAATGVRPKPSAGDQDPGPREEVVERLKQGRADIEARVRALTEAQLGETITGLFGGETTRFGFLSFAYGHEMYHWGQLGLCARAGGEIPALTRFIEARRRAPAAAPEAAS